MVPLKRNLHFFNRTLSLFLSPPICFLLVFSVSGGANTEQAQVHFLHALKLKQEGNFLAAESLLQKAIEIEPENPDFRFELGNLYIERGNLEGARMELEQAVMIAPAHIPAHYNLGLVYRDLELTSEARGQFRRILELDPNHIRAQLQIGYTYEQEGFFDDARLAFEEAREMDMTDPEPRNALEELASLENYARDRTRRQMAESFQRNQRSLYFPDSQPSSLYGEGTLANPSQPSGREALAQAGALLIQELLARRSKAAAENNETGQS